MAGYAVIAIENVLARVPDGDHLVRAMPITEGVTLYQALKQTHKIALVTNAASLEKVQHWLRVNGLAGYTIVVLERTPRQGRSLRGEQLECLRAQGYSVDLFIDADPAAVAEAVHMGVTSLCFVSPRYARPEFRPDATNEIRPWDAIAAEVDAQNELRVREPVPTADLA